VNIAEHISDTLSLLLHIFVFLCFHLCFSASTLPLFLYTFTPLSVTFLLHVSLFVPQLLPLSLCLSSSFSLSIFILPSLSSVTFSPSPLFASLFSSLSYVITYFFYSLSTFDSPPLTLSLPYFPLSFPLCLPRCLSRPSNSSSVSLPYSLSISVGTRSLPLLYALCHSNLSWCHAICLFLFIPLPAVYSTSPIFSPSTVPIPSLAVLPSFIFLFRSSFLCLSVCLQTLSPPFIPLSLSPLLYLF
jgi:hypothetical protein